MGERAQFEAEAFYRFAQCQQVCSQPMRSAAQALAKGLVNYRCLLDVAFKLTGNVDKNAFGAHLPQESHCLAVEASLEEQPVGKLHFVSPQ